MHQPLIFTERRPGPKVFDALMTIVAWAGFFYLIYYGLVKAITQQPALEARPVISAFGALSLYFLVSLLNGLVLIIWAKYNQHRFRVERRKRRPDLERSEVAASFKITPQLAAELNKGRVQTVYHDHDGGIDHVEVNSGVTESLLPAPGDNEMLQLLKVGGADSLPQQSGEATGSPNRTNNQL